MQAGLDAIDHAILAALCADARQKLAEIATEVGLSASAVKRRIDRLERDGVIVGYTIRVDHSRLGTPLEAFTELRFAGSSTVEDIRGAIAMAPEAKAAYTTAGDPDALVQLRVKSVDHLKETINRMRRSGKVTGTKTLIVLDSWSAD